MTQTITNGQTVTVDSTENQNYVIQNGTLDVVTGGQVVGQYDNPFDPAAVAGSEYSATVNLDGGEILAPGGSHETLGGVAVEMVQLTVDSGSITGGQAATQAGAAVSGGSATVQGGSVTGGPGGTAGGAAFDGCAVTVHDGTVTGGSGITGGGAAISGGSAAVVTGGTVTGGTAGTVGGAAIERAHTVTISGGTVQGGSNNYGDAAPAIQGGSIRITGGTVVGDLQRIDGLALSVGEIQGNVQLARGFASITSGTVTGTIAYTGPSNLTVQGGSLTGALTLSLTRGASVVVHGGAFHGGWRLADRSTATVYGSGLTFSNGQLTGTLADGSPIDIHVEVGLNSHVYIHNV